MKAIRIMSANLDLEGEIDNYLSFSITRKYDSSGEFQLVINRKVENADRLNINQLVMLGADTKKVGIIRYREIKTNEKGEEILTVKGSTLGGILKQRITIPPYGQSHDIQESNAETVMKNYVKRNCLDISGMEFPMLMLGDNLGRGENVKWQSRYKNLEEELDLIGRFANLGWHIYLDFNLKRWVFDVYSGRNLSANQNIYPPVIFSPDFDNVKSQEYIDSLMNFGNFAIVAGQGEGAERDIIMIGSEDLGLDRHVIFVDARDINNINDLEGRAKVKLNEHKETISFKSEVLGNGPFEYEKDWNLGDIVTVQNKDWDIIMDTRITEVTEIYEAGGFKLKVNFGDNLPTLTQKIKGEFQEIKIESTR